MEQPTNSITKMIKIGKDRVDPQFIATYCPRETSDFVNQEVVKYYLIEIVLKTGDKIISFFGTDESDMNETLERLDSLCIKTEADTP